MSRCHPAMIDSRDRGLAYGDGLFETLRVGADGRIPLWTWHQQRLVAGARTLGIPAPDAAQLEQALAQARVQLQGPGLIKLMLTRGVGGRGYLPPADAQPALLWQTGQ